MDNDKILNDYLDAISDIPLPTKEQTGRFFCHVLMAHSWYKHLPPIPPGHRFFFYIDPNVARIPQFEKRPEKTTAEELQRKGRWERKLIGFRDAEKSDLSHHADNLTHVYHEKFGYWNFDFSRFSRQNQTSSKIVNRQLVYIPIPQQLIEAGTCYLTGWLSGKESMLMMLINTLYRSKERIKASDDEASFRFLEFFKNWEKRDGIYRTRISPERNAKSKEIEKKMQEKLNEYKGLKQFFRRKQMREEFRQLQSDMEELRKPCEDPEISELDKKITDFVEHEVQLQRKNMMQTINNVYDLVKELRENH